jgi:hypothetical protein
MVHCSPSLGVYATRHGSFSSPGKADRIEQELDAGVHGLTQTTLAEMCRWHPRPCWTQAETIHQGNRHQTIIAINANGEAFHSTGLALLICDDANPLVLGLVL